MRIFLDSEVMSQSANFGWQNKDLALYGLREGYKSSADDLLDLALQKGDPKTLDTYIFPILFSYRHCLEISLKHIYLRCFSHIQCNGHNLLDLWDKVKKDVIDDFINSQSAINEVKAYKESFVPYSFNDISFHKIRDLLKELQEANQQNIERTNPSKRQTDENADVWRYLITTDENLYFTCSHSIDYLALKESIGYLYDVFEFVFHIADSYLSS